MAKKPNTIGPWQYLGGTSRRYFNPKTGKFLSREAYDREYGSLKKRGFTSFKRAAKATSVEIREARPSKSVAYRARSRAGGRSFSGLRPLAGKRSRGATVPFSALWYGDPDEFLDSAEDYRSYYDDAIHRIGNNSAIVGVQVFYNFTNQDTGFTGIRPVGYARPKENPLSYDDMLYKMIDEIRESATMEIGPLTIIVSFGQAWIKPDFRKALRIMRKKKRK
jgi:hypothetical protein